MKKELEHIIETNKLIKISKASFWNAFDNYKNEEKEEYNRVIGNSVVSIELNSISYEILIHQETEIIKIKFNVFAGKKALGDYSLILDYQSKHIVDDYFVLW